MTDLAFWKVALDGALVLSLIYFCVRNGRGSFSASVHPNEIRELEGALRRIVKEADLASSDLSQSLGKQKRDLEELLFDLKTTESRLNKTIDGADETRKALLSQSQRVAAAAPIDPLPVEQPPMPPVPPQPIPQPQLPPQVSTQVTNPPAPPTPVQPEMPEPPSFERPTSDSINIYGEQIMSENEPTRLVDTIERITYEPDPIPNPAPTAVESVEDVYAAAEELLKAGRELEYVSAKTDLPLDEVRMLAEIVERQRRNDEAEAVVQPSDSRLGVLGGIRRERHVL